MERRESMQKEDWFMDIENRLQGASYPMERDMAEEKLKGASVEGEDVSKYFDEIDWPVSSPDDLREKIRWARGSSGKERATSGVPGLQ